MAVLLLGGLFLQPDVSAEPAVLIEVLQLIVSETMAVGCVDLCHTTKDISTGASLEVDGLVFHPYY